MLVIDMQDSMRDWVPRFDDLLNNIAKLILTFQMFEMPVLVTEQDPAVLGNTVESIRKLFKFLEVTEKMELAATDNPHFLAQLNPLNAKTFVVCGVETHVCVSQTVLSLLDRGMTVHVVADAVNARHALSHSVGLRKMELAGAHITTTEMCLFELAEKAGVEGFKNIQRMVKGKFIPGGRQKIEETKHNVIVPRTALVKAPSEQPPKVLEVLDAMASTVTEAPIHNDAPAPMPEGAADKSAIGDASLVDDILNSLGPDEETAATSSNDKSELEINKELNDIDSLLKGLESGEKKE